MLKSYLPYLSCEPVVSRCGQVWRGGYYNCTTVRGRETGRLPRSSFRLVGCSLNAGKSHLLYLSLKSLDQRRGVISFAPNSYRWSPMGVAEWNVYGSFRRGGRETRRVHRARRGATDTRSRAPAAAGVLRSAARAIPPPPRPLTSPLQPPEIHDRDKTRSFLMQRVIFTILHLDEAWRELGSSS